MTKMKVLELAKQGNPKAIASLMNHSLEPRRITVAVSPSDRGLTIQATAPQPPDRAFLVDFIRQGLERLDAATIQRVMIRAYGKGSRSPVWQEMLVLRDDPPMMPVSNVAALQTANTSVPAATRSPTRPPRTRPRSTLLESIKTIFGFCFYFIGVGAAFYVAGLLRFVSAILAEKYIYTIQFLGDLLRGLEVAEVLTILVCGILGLVLGLITVLVPRSIGHRFSAALLGAAVLVLFFFGSVIRYQDWVSDFAQPENPKLADVKTDAKTGAKVTDLKDAYAITDEYLKRQVGVAGFPGFYLHTARYPLLPMRQSEMKDATDLDTRISSRIASGLKKIANVETQPRTISLIFSACIWGIRLFYLLLSIVAASLYFDRGKKLADKWAKRDIA
jgi:hypothetical protein